MDPKDLEILCALFASMIRTAYKSQLTLRLSILTAPWTINDELNSKTI